MVRVFVYRANTLHIPSQLFEMYLSILSIDEQQRYKEINSQNKKQQFLVGRALLRYVLGIHSNVTPSCLRFLRTQDGKPFLENSKLQFNISHKENIVFCAVSIDIGIGIDVENICKERAFLSISNEYFANCETQSLMPLKGKQLKENFYRYWCLKEAYLKATGTGLWGMDRVAFALAHSSIHRVLPDTHSPKASFIQYLLNRSYMLTIALLVDTLEFGDINFFKVLPLVDITPSSPPSVMMGYGH